jgi:predicted thioesterase
VGGGLIKNLKEYPMDNHTLTSGLSLELEFEILPEHSAAHIGSGSVQVLSTPSMIAFMEITSLKLLDAHLPDGHSSVGARVDIRHLAPSPVGCTVRVQAEITSVDGRAVLLQVDAWEGEKHIGSGTHQRFVIDVERFLGKMQ